MKRSTLIQTLCVGTITLTTTLTASAATFNWLGGNTNNLNSTNYDTGTSPVGNTQADIVNITNGGLVVNSSQVNLEGIDLYNLSNGGIIHNSKNNKIIKGNNTTVNVGADSFIGAANMRDITMNFSGNATYIVGQGGGNKLQSATINFDSTWTGEIFFTASIASEVTTFDKVSDVTDWLDTAGNSGGADKLFLNGVALTTADLGSKFALTVVTSESENAPTLATRDFGVSLILVPEPSSLALLGLGGLLIARRRRA